MLWNGRNISAMTRTLKSVTDINVEARHVLNNIYFAIKLLCLVIKYKSLKDVINGWITNMLIVSGCNLLRAVASGKKIPHIVILHHSSKKVKNLFSTYFRLDLFYDLFLLQSTEVCFHSSSVVSFFSFISQTSVFISFKK